MEITKRTIRSISSSSEQEILFLDDDVSNTNDTDFSYVDNNDTDNTNTNAMRPQAHHFMDTKSMVNI